MPSDCWVNCQLWLAPPLVVQVSSWAPAAVLWPGSSRALPPAVRVWVPLRLPAGAVPTAVMVRVCSAAVREPPTALPVLLVQYRAGVVSASRPVSADRPMTRPL